MRTIYVANNTTSESKWRKHVATGLPPDSERLSVAPHRYHLGKAQKGQTLLHVAQVNGLSCGWAPLS